MCDWLISYKVYYYYNWDVFIKAVFSFGGEGEGGRGRGRGGGGEGRDLKKV